MLTHLVDTDIFSKILTSGLNKLIGAEQEITNADELVGDGDCGMALKQGAEAVLRFIADGKVAADAVVTVAGLAEVVEEHMGGTSGAIYSFVLLPLPSKLPGPNKHRIFLNSLATALRETGEGTATSGTWAAASRAALVSLGKYTPAQPGDRTLVDALQPFVASLVDGKGVAAAARAARDGAESTRGMEAKLGRSVYVGEIGDTLDPGALGIAVLAEGFAEALEK